MSHSTAQNSEIRSPIVASWVLLIVTCLLALIPLFGFITWIVGSVTVTIAIILAVVVISKGGTWNGIFIILTSLIVVPVFLFFAPIVSTLVAGVLLDEHSSSADSSLKIEISSDSPESEVEGVHQIDDEIAGSAENSENGAIEADQDAAETPAVTEPAAEAPPGE